MTWGLHQTLLGVPVLGCGSMALVQGFMAWPCYGRSLTSRCGEQEHCPGVGDR
ncbi:hypothetical protein [Prochlorothrix hollandica]|uniref:hypothetical protein n=1 Tax=Prochlorothrix hollandica TaxID=1223 RepID=UPI00034B505A|nr:hypothetical protein [Prochlorothrix hollandica]